MFVSYVFISYFREDTALVKRLKAQLDAFQVNYWIDEEGMEPGEEWERKIRRKIEDAGIFLLCLSKSYNRKTSYVHKEIDMAVAHAAKLDSSVTWIVPVAFDDVEIPDIRAFVGLIESIGIPKSALI